MPASQSIHDAEAALAQLGQFAENVKATMTERDRYFKALTRIATQTGDDSAVQIATQALMEARPFVCNQCEGRSGDCLRCNGTGFVA